MIRLIQGSHKARFPREIDEMHQIRARVFNERLGWDVTVIDGWEIDIFDSLNPLYLLSVDEFGKVRGSLRLLPTTGPNMLRDVFSYLLPEGETVESGTVWESSRFCVDHTYRGERALAMLQKVTGELLLGMHEVCHLAGLTGVVTVYDAYMARILKHMQAHGEPLADPTRVNGVLTHVGFFEADEENRIAFSRAAGIEEGSSVIEPASLERVVRVA